MDLFRVHSSDCALFVELLFDVFIRRDVFQQFQQLREIIACAHFDSFTHPAFYKLSLLFCRIWSS
jgi:hypothetical protein